MFIWQLTSILLLLFSQAVYANRLHDAVQHGRIEELRALLDSIDSRGVIQSCECYFFGSYCDPCSVDDSHRGGLTPLIYAGGLGSTDAMELLIAAGADLDETNSEGMSAALHSAWTGHYMTLEILINAHADLNLANIDGMAPLQAAAIAGHVSTVKMLVDSTAHIDWQTKTGWTATMYAAAKAHIGVLKVLTKKKADLDIISKDGQTALLIAAKQAKHSASAVIQLLLAAGADPDIPGPDGMPVLMTLLSSKKALDIGTVHALVNAGAYLGSINKARAASDNSRHKRARQSKDSAVQEVSTSPVYVAAERGHTKAFEALLAARAPFDSERLLRHIAAGARNQAHKETLEKLMNRYSKPADTRLSDDQKKLGDGDDFVNTRGQEGSNLHSNAESQHGSGERRIDL